MLLKPDKGPEFPQNVHLIRLSSTIDKIFEIITLKIVQRHTEERGLLNASKFAFCACYSMVLQCMKLTAHITLNFNNNLSTAAVFLVTVKAFDTT
jgi:uncharacterized membrane protein